MRSKRLRVLHVLNELRASGAEVMLRVAADDFRSAGIDCEILSLGEQLGSYAKPLKGVGYPVHHLIFSKSFAFFWALREFGQKNKYDVVHFHVERASSYLHWSVFPLAKIVQ